LEENSIVGECSNGELKRFLMDAQFKEWSYYEKPKQGDIMIWNQYYNSNLIEYSILENDIIIKRVRQQNDSLRYILSYDDNGNHRLKKFNHVSQAKKFIKENKQYNFSKA
jgi:hypothetical protein